MLLLSIIVPIYNIEQYLPCCIDSILGQTYQNIEVILVDDGSVDDSPSICDNYASKYNNIQVIHKENGGLSEARNSGIKAASGEYIVFLDGDDFLLPDSLEKLDKHIKSLEEPVDVIFARLDEYSNNKIITHDYKKWEEFQIKGKTGIKILCDMITNHLTIWSASANVYNRTFLVKNAIFFDKDQVGAEDLDVFSKVMSIARRFSLYRESICCYRLYREGSITTKLSAKSLKAQLFLYNKWFEFYSKLNSQEEDIQVIRGFYADLYIKKTYRVATVDKSKRKEIRDYIKANKNILYYPTGLKSRIIVLLYFIIGLKIGTQVMSIYHIKDRNGR